MTLKILITNITLGGYTGTETATWDLAVALKKRGHFPMIYTSLLGGVSLEIAADDIPIFTDLTQLPHRPDIIHGHHHIETLQALVQFPETPCLFVCHDRFSPNAIPPNIDRISFFVAVDSDRKLRCTQDYGIDEKKMVLIPNWVHCERFKRREPLPPKPQRALIFSNYVKNPADIQIISAACEKLQLPLDLAGFGMGKGSSKPEEILSQYDIVFASGKCALEAMGTGTAVVLCDPSGMAGMITAKNVGAFRDYNFGKRVLTHPLAVDQMIGEIQKYDVTDAAIVTNFIREEASLEKSINAYLSLYARMLQESKITSALPLSQSLLDYACHCGKKMGALEEEVRRYRLLLDPNLSMEPLDMQSCGQLSLNLLENPQTVELNERFTVSVELKNDSECLIGSYYPAPIYFSYHWFTPDKNTCVEFEGLRTRFELGLKPHTQANFKVNVKAPHVPGFYCLVLTLIQDGVAWFDKLSVPIQTETVIQVI